MTSLSPSGKNLWFFDDIASQLGTFSEIALRQAQAEMHAAAITPQQARNAAFAAEVAPNASNDLITAAGLANIDAATPAFQEIAKREDAERERGFFDPLKAVAGGIFTAVKGTTRVAALVMDSAYEELLARPFRALVGEGKISMFGSGDSKSGESSGLKALHALRSGERVNLGSGFIPRSTRTEERPEFAQLRDRGVAPGEAAFRLETGTDGSQEFGRPITQIADEEQRELQFSGFKAGENTHGGNPEQSIPISFGRVFASTVTEPGTTNFNVLSGAVDAAAQIALDPAARLTLGAAQISKARKTFGAIEDAARPTVWGVRTRGVNEFLTGPEGLKLAKWVEKQNGAEGVNAIRARFGKNLPRRMYADLADAKDVGAVDQILRKYLGKEIGQVPRKAFNARARTWGQDRFSTLHRLSSDMPGTHIDIKDLDAGLNQFDEFMIAARVSPERRGEMMYRWSLLEDGDAPAAWNIAREILEKDMTQNLSHISGAAQKHFSRVWKRMAAQNEWAEDAIGKGYLAPGAELKMIGNDELEVLGSAMTYAEYVHSAIPLPDARQLRRALRKHNRAVKDGAITTDHVGQSLDTLMSRYWKPMVLLRGAWPVRVVGEEQIRAATYGFDSFANHPIRALQVAMAKKLPKDMGKLKSGILDANGESQAFEMMQEFQSAMSHHMGGLLGRQVKDNLTHAWVRKVKGVDADYSKWWMAEMKRMNNDELGSRLARNKDDGMAWWLSKAGTTARKQVAGKDPAKAVIVTDIDAARVYAESVHARAVYNAGGRFRVVNKDTKEVLRDWNGKTNFRQLKGSKTAQLDTPWSKIEYQIDPKFAGNPELMALQADGHILGVSIAGLAPTHKDFRTISKQTFNKYGKYAPDNVQAGLTDATGAARSFYDDTTEFMFNALGAKPTNYLSRSPVFKQSYWEETIRLAGFADDKTFAQIVAGAEKAGLTKPLRKQLDNAIKARKKAGTTFSTFVDVDDLAKAKALRTTKDLLYDLNRRHQWTDITRHIFPFGEAWQEILTTWGRLATTSAGQTAHLIRRGTQAVEGARGAGFFTEDPTTGQEMFNYPGAGLLAEWAMGGSEGVGDSARVEFRGDVSSLNLFTQSFLPGTGPALQIPWSILGPDIPDVQFIDEFIVPFGRQEIDSAGGIIDANLPAWFKKMYTAAAGESATGDLHRMYGNTVMDVYKTMVLGGSGSDKTPEEANATMDDAKKASRYLFFVRGMLQFVAPAAPIPKFEVEVGKSSQETTYAELANVVPKDDPRDEGGQFLQLQVIASDYRAQLEHRFDWDEVAATKWFLSTYGMEPHLLTTPKTAVIKRRSVTHEGLNFELDNKDIFSEFPLTAYYASPDDEVAEFDYQAYLRSLRTGARVSLTPDQWLMNVNSQAASFQFENARRVLEEGGYDDAVTSQVLGGYRLFLKERYPGYLVANYGVAERPRIEQVIAEFEDWSDNEKLRNTSAGKGLALYLERRAAVMRVVEEQLGLKPASFATALRARAFRDILRDEAAKIIANEETKDFGNMWNLVFSNELREDQDQQVTVDVTGAVVNG